MLKATDFKPTDLCYTFVADDGTNYHIASSLLRKHCLEKLGQTDIFLLALRPKLAASFITKNVVHPLRVASLRPQDLFEPVIFCSFDKITHPNGHPDAMLVDGHHRYCRLALEGEKYIRAYILAEKIWKDFQIEDDAFMRTYTKEELEAEPIAQKPHWK